MLDEERVDQEIDNRLSVRQVGANDRRNSTTIRSTAPSMLKKDIEGKLIPQRYKQSACLETLEQT